MISDTYMINAWIGTQLENELIDSFLAAPLGMRRSSEVCGRDAICELLHRAVTGGATARAAPTNRVIQHSAGVTFM